MSKMRAALLLVFGPVFAVTWAADAEQSETDASSISISEVLVTAQRREQRLQDVPIAVTAVTAEDLERAQVRQVQDIAQLTPGLTMNQSIAVVSPYLRGVGTQSVAAGEEHSIATYVDGVYVGAPFGSLFSLNGIERVEVLKGPQGTLFGRNATGGLIHIITADPDPVFRARAGIEGGNYGTVGGKLYATGGLSRSVAADLSLYYLDQSEGMGRNFITGEETNQAEEYAARTKFLWRPTDATSVKLSLDAQKRTSDIAISRRPLPGTVSIGGFTFSGSPWDVQLSHDANAHTAQRGGSVVFEHEFGAVTLTSTSAVRDYKNRRLIDNDGGPLFFLIAQQVENTTTYQQEFLFTGERDKLQWTSGVFLYRADAEYDPITLDSALIPPQRRMRFTNQRTDSYAAFGQGTYALTDATRITAGARYTQETKEYEGQDVAGPGYVGPPIPGVISADADFSKVTWRLALDHDISDDVLAYISASRGFKSGEFNLAAISTTPVRPETLDSIEVGIKSEVIDRRLRLNASVFQYDYTDIQLSRTELGVTTIFNAAEGESRGIDLEAVFAPPVGAGRLEFMSGVALLDTEYKSFPNAPFFYPNPAVCNAPGTSTPGQSTGPPTGGNLSTCAGDAAGHKMIRAPDVTANLTARYSIDAGAGVLDFSVTGYYNDGFYWDPDNRIRQPAYTTLGGDVSYQRGPFRVRVFGRNLTNEEYFAQVSSSTFADMVSYGAARTYGLGLEWNFGE